LREQILDSVEVYSQRVAKKIAKEILQKYRLWPEDSSDYQPSTGLSGEHALPPVQDPSKPRTRSNRRRKHPVEDLDQPVTSTRKKRKQGTTHTEPTDLSSSFSQKDSFMTSTSANDEMPFPFETDESAQGPAFSFSVPTTATHLQEAPDFHLAMSTDPLSSTGISSRQSSRSKGKGKASRRGKA
jgi:hypothetical protein